MTYVELIVVLTIFAIMTSVVLFNYGAFQGRVDVKNLANDLALKIVQAEKDASFGKVPSLAQQAGVAPNWKPSYGTYFDLATDNTTFYYFADLNQNKYYDASSCGGSGECISSTKITRGGTIAGIKTFPGGASLQKASLSFTRPNSIVTVVDLSHGAPVIVSGVNYIEISVKSPASDASIITLYPSGRVEIK